MHRLAISRCPNDTFAFYALIHGKTSWSLPLEVSYGDIEELNRLCFEGRVHFSKVSFGAYLHLRDRFSLIDAGSALGSGCGPLVVASRHMPVVALKHKTIATPGCYTTASLLLKLLLGADVDTVEQSFDSIMPAVVRGDVDAGLIIHESRFTYQDHGLLSLIDLGDWWEKESGHPIPLGGIIADGSLPASLICEFNDALVESIDYAWAHWDEVLPYMQQHAQEMDADVMQKHVSLYVNAFTRSLGSTGHAAIDYLLSQARINDLI